jgi:hypothetical protein
MSGALVESIVTLAAAALMTVAGFAMVDDMLATSKGGTLATAIVAAPAAAAAQG